MRIHFRQNIDMKFATPAEIEHAAAALQRGELVALPTETVYGLGADATNAAAIASTVKIVGLITPLSILLSWLYSISAISAN